MKKITRIVVIVLAVSFLSASAVYAGDNPGSKLGRGFSNIVTSPLQYIVQTSKLNEDHDGVTALLGGLVNGTGFMVWRMCVGVYEVATFPIPLPSKYGPVLDPDTSLTDLKDTLKDVNERQF